MLKPLPKPKKIDPNQNLNMEFKTAINIKKNLIKNNYKNEIMIPGFGEPLLNKNFLKILNIFSNSFFTELISNGDVLKKNQTGFVQPKIKPITKTITPLKAITKTKPASRFGRVMKALRKNPKTAAAALAIGTGVYLYNQGKKKPNGIIPPVGGGKTKSVGTADINFTLGGKGGYGVSAGRTSKGAN